MSMSSNKIIRTICYFTDTPSTEVVKRVESLAKILENSGYLIQTKRIGSPLKNISELKELLNGSIGYANVGTLTYDEATNNFVSFLGTANLSLNIDLTREEIGTNHADLLYKIIKENPAKTFDFAFTFNNVASSPYFPSANYEKNGFAIGLQPTNLARGCNMLGEWLEEMKKCWSELIELFGNESDFLGIDSSIAPYQTGDSSFIYFVKRLFGDFSKSTTTDFYTKVTTYIKENNPKPIGLCGLMFPCLEDIDLAKEYDSGNFSIERNIFLSLHSGLGIDTYPVGIDEKPERIVEILKLLQTLSNKYQKPLSARFVSDGKAKVGEKTNFGHEHLTDCIVRSL
jgi:hypothetical protein